jgi:hypothetical protein
VALSTVKWIGSNDDPVHVAGRLHLHARPPRLRRHGGALESDGLQAIEDRELHADRLAGAQLVEVPEDVPHQRRPDDDRARTVLDARIVYSIRP